MCVNYGGRRRSPTPSNRSPGWPRRAGSSRNKIDERTIARYLTSPDMPDVTCSCASSGEQRTSTSCSGSRRTGDVFLDTLFPASTAAHLAGLRDLRRPQSPVRRRCGQGGCGQADPHLRRLGQRLGQRHRGRRFDGASDGSTAMSAESARQRQQLLDVAKEHWSASTRSGGRRRPRCPSGTASPLRAAGVELSEGLEVLQPDLRGRLDLPADSDIHFRLPSAPARACFGHARRGPRRARLGRHAALRFPGRRTGRGAMGTLLMLVVSNASTLRTELLS